MTQKTKQSIIEYIKAHDDGSANTKDLISKLEGDLNKEMFICCIPPETILKNLTPEETADLRKYLDKPQNERFTIYDADLVSEWAADYFHYHIGSILSSAIFSHL